MSVLSQQLSLHISYMSGPSQKNLPASFSIGCLEVALQKYSLAKQSRRKMVEISVIVFWHLSPLVSNRGWVRRGKQTGRSFHIPILDFRAPQGMFLHCMGIKSCCSDSLVTGFPVALHSCLGLLSRYSKGDVGCGNKSCSNSIPFPLFIMWFSNTK